VLFRRSEEKRAEKRGREAAIQAEVDRLKALSPEELAVEVLPILAAEAAKSTGGRLYVSDICRKLVGTVSGRVNLALNQPVREALQRLEHANLVLQVASADMGSSWRITTEGEHGLAAGKNRRQAAPVNELKPETIRQVTSQQPRRGSRPDLRSAGTNRSATAESYL
jgi:hypothetical protein